MGARERERERPNRDVGGNRKRGQYEGVKRKLKFEREIARYDMSDRCIGKGKEGGLAK